MQNSIEQSFHITVPKWQKIIIFAMMATAFLTLWSTLYTPVLDGDIWFHLLYGQQIFENHTLTPDHTIYSWTPSSNEHIYCAWIGQITYYLFYKYFGIAGIIALRYIIATCFFLLIFHLACQRNTLYNPITWFSATLCVLVITTTFFDKPEAMSFTLMAGIIWNWFQIKQLNKRLLFHIYFFPLLILVWVNTHGGFLFGCLFLLCVGIGETLNQLLYRKNALPRSVYYHLLIALTLSLGAIFITPYGYDYIHQLALQYFDKQLSDDLTKVIAYRPTFEKIGVYYQVIFADTAIALLALVFLTALYKRQIDFVPIISNILFAFLFTVYGRLTLFWVPIFGISVTYYSSVIVFSRPRWNIFFVLLCALATFTLSGWITYKNIQSPPRDRWLDFGVTSGFTLEEETDYIARNFKENRLGNVYDQGAYISWKLWPATKVMMDARYFPYKKWANEYFSTFQAGKNIEEFTKKYPFEVMVIPHRYHTPMKWFQKSKEWQLAFYGYSAVIFVRSSLNLPHEPIQGKGLTNLPDYSTALGVFNSAVLLNDWTGTEVILATMRRTFTSKKEQKQIAGLEEVNLAAQLYEQKKYDEAIALLKKAGANGATHKRLMGDTLLMKALEEWQNKQWDTALKFAIQSIHVHDTFTTTYDLALMAWQRETISPEAQADKSSLTEYEKDSTGQWRKALQQLIDIKDKLPVQTYPYLENARCILEGKNDCRKELVLPDTILYLQN